MTLGWSERTAFTTLLLDLGSDFKELAAALAAAVAGIAWNALYCGVRDNVADILILPTQAVQCRIGRRFDSRTCKSTAAFFLHASAEQLAVGARPQARSPYSGNLYCK